MSELSLATFAGDGITLRELAGLLGGTVEGDPETRIFCGAGFEDAKPGAILRVENARYLSKAVASEASALLIPAGLDPGGKSSIRVENVRLAFLRCLEIFRVDESKPAGIHTTAVIGPGCQIHPSCSVGAYAVIGRNAKLSPGAVVHAHAILGDDVEIGSDSIIYPNAVLYSRTIVGSRVRIHAGAVIGADGFGYEWTGAQHLKRPHNGRAFISDDVEIGANTTVDRATTGETIIGPGTKIDNLVQVAHNCRTGSHCIILSQTGLSGSITLGSGVVLGGQVGLHPNVKIGDGTKVAGRAVVWRDLPAGKEMSGNPAQEHSKELRIQAASRRLPEILKRVRKLESR